MEAQGAQRRRSPSPPPPPPPPTPEIKSSPKEEESLQDSILEEQAAARFSVDALGETEEELVEDEGAAPGSEEVPAVLTDDLLDKIVRQVEYYFSDENLPADKFMLKFVMKDKQGFVPIAVIASFRRMQRLVKDLSLIETALRKSSQLVVSKDGRKVRRLRPLPVTKVKDHKLCTVIVENLPDDYSMDNLQKIFGNVGKILNITIHDPHSTEESELNRKSETAVSSKLHALIDYETTKAAASAVVTLNDEKNWRSGMRVELLNKWMSKYGIRKQHKETIFENTNNNHASEMASDGQNSKSVDHHNEKAEKEEEEHFGGGKGRRKSRYSRGRGRSQQNSSGQGPGQVPSSSSNGVTKPPPGPQMPDGTRGFSMGRGKPSTCELN